MRAVSLLAGNVLLSACGGNSETTGGDEPEDGNDSSTGGDGTGGTGGTDPTGGSGGTGAEGTTTGGTGSAEIDCTGTFGEPEILLEDTLPYSPALTDDELVLFYANGENGNEDFKVSVRADTDEPFPPATTLPELDALCEVNDDRTIDASLDGLRAYFSCYPPDEVGSADHPLYMAERADRSSSFDPPVQVASFASSASVSADELSVYGSGYDATTTLISTRTSIDQPFGDALPLPELEGRGFFAPVMAPGGLEIYGSSSGVIYFATRSDATADFGPTQQLDIIPDGYASGGSVEISNDCRKILFVAFLRDGGGHILQATR